MLETRSHRTFRGVHATLAAAAVGYVVWALLIRRSALIQEPGLALLLGLGAVAAARWSRADPDARSPRFAMTFALAAFVLLPPPAGMLIALAAALAAGGGGVAGGFGGGPARLAPLAAGLVLSQVFAGLWFDQARAPSVTLVGLTLAFLLAQFAAAGLGTLCAPAAAAPPPPGRFDAWRPRVLELLNVPLAWLLAAAVTRGAWLQAVGVAGLTLFIGWSLVRLGRALADLGRTNDALARRLSELGTLHAIGREILSSLDPSQVFGIIERECGKIFDVDVCTVTLRDRTTSELRVHFLRRRGETAATTPGPVVTRGLIAEVGASKRSVRIEDCRSLPADSPYRGESLAPETRAAMAVPLIVKERVVGVILLESRTTGAYDEHQLSVLNTIAQQAAVAIENARNYALATVDSLTGFSARDYFFRRLEEEHTRVARYGGHYALLMLDLDGFKKINDRHGHLAGDRYLRAIADTVRSRLRDADLPCRYGGDEFCVLLPETQLAGAQIIAERIRVAVSSLVVRQSEPSQALQTTISIGVAAFPDHDPGKLQGLLRNADEALYRAKRAGRNCVVPFAA